MHCSAFDSKYLVIFINFPAQNPRVCWRRSVGVGGKIQNSNRNLKTNECCFEIVSTARSIFGRIIQEKKEFFIYLTDIAFLNLRGPFYFSCFTNLFVLPKGAMIFLY